MAQDSKKTQLAKNVEYFYKIANVLFGVTQAEFAFSILGISRGTLYNITHGKTVPQRNVINTIADKFNEITGADVTPDDFMEKDISKIVPMEAVFKKSVTSMDDIFKLIRNSRKISLRRVSQISKEIFADEPQKQLSPSYLLRLEQGRYSAPSLTKLESIFTILGLPKEILIGITEQEKEKDKIIIDLSGASEETKRIIKQQVKELLRNFETVRIEV